MIWTEWLSVQIFSKGEDIVELCLGFSVKILTSVRNALSCLSVRTWKMNGAGLEGLLWCYFLSMLNICFEIFQNSNIILSNTFKFDSVYVAIDRITILVLVKKNWFKASIFFVVAVLNAIFNFSLLQYSKFS